MRLLDARTFRLKTFFNNIPPYAILSHCWEDEEVVFSDLDDLEEARKKKGFAKLQKTCELAIEDGFEYAWIDTCCIDKSSSAELSEAINSMFSWYRNSKQCYAYLADTYFTKITLPDLIGIGADKELPVNFAGSRWFKRAWTLQELLAPRSLHPGRQDGMKFYPGRQDGMKFYSNEWLLFGDKISLAESISEITGVPTRYLEGQSLQSASISMRMSWAAGRQARRSEDIAYSLLGLFDVNMPLLYGEGKVKAFRRLQEEIMKSSEDETLFAWESAHSSTSLDVLANDPDDFSEASQLVPFASDVPVPPYAMTHRGLRIWLPLFETQQLNDDDRLTMRPLRSPVMILAGVDIVWAVLRCHLMHDFDRTVIIPLRCLSANVYLRDTDTRISLISEASLPATMSTKEIYMRNSSTAAISDSVRRRFGFLIRKLPADSYISQCFPKEAWNDKDRILQGKRDDSVASSWKASLQLTFPSLVNKKLRKAGCVVSLTFGCTQDEHDSEAKPHAWYSTDKYGPVDYHKAMESSFTRQTNAWYATDNVTSSDLDLKVTITPRKIFLQDMFVVDIEMGGLYESITVEEFKARRKLFKTRDSQETLTGVDQDWFTPDPRGTRVSQSSVLAVLGLRRAPTE